MVCCFWLPLLYAVCNASFICRGNMNFYYHNDAFQMWQFAPNSVHYLLSLWQRMVAPVPYVKASEPHLLETYTPEVTKAYITSRLDSVSIVLR